MISFLEQVVVVVLWILVIKLCQISIYPYLKPALGKLSYGLSYPIGFLLLTITSWYLGLMHLPVILSLLLFIILIIFALVKKYYVFSELKEEWKWDALFVGSFLFLLLTYIKLDRLAVFPVGAELMMDLAFLGSIMNNPTVIPADPWFSGENLSIYYYLGHWIMGVLGIIVGSSHTIIYNLMLPTVFSLASISLYSIGIIVLKRHQWLPIVVLVLPNIALIYNILSGESIARAAANSMNVIANTLNHYPLCSFVGGATHAHVFGCFNQVLFIALLVLMFFRWNTLSKLGRYLLLIIQSLSLGSMVGFHTWDVLMYAPLYIIVSFIVWYTAEERSLKSCLAFLLVPIVSILTYLPFILSVLLKDSETIHGIDIVPIPSNIFEFIGVYGIFLIIFVAYGLPYLKGKPWLLVIPIIFGICGHLSAGVALFCILLLCGKKSLNPSVIFGVYGLFLIFLMEFIYVEGVWELIHGASDFRYVSYGKVEFCAWFLLGISALLIVGDFIKSRFKWLTGRKVYCCIMCCLLLVIIVPFGYGLGDYGYPNGSLDCSVWMETQEPGDYYAIQYLNSVSDNNDIIVEAVGYAYCYEGRVSAFTGLSTIMGWTHHETHWRWGLDEINQREADVQLIYENPLIALDLLEKYNVTYIYVGELERTKYNVSLPFEVLTEIYSENDTYIYEYNQNKS